MSNNVYLRKDGRYESRLTTAIIDGKRKYKAFFGKTPEEAIKKLEEFRRKMTVMTVNVEMTFSEIYTEWFNSVSYRVKASTAAAYTFKADKHILPKFAEFCICNIDHNMIYQFIREKQDAGLSNRYISDILIEMKAVFKYAARTYHTTNPMEGLIMPKKQKSEIRLLNDEEQKRLMGFLFQKRNHTNMGIILTWLTGLRIGELCAAQWKDIDLKKRILTVSKTLQRVQTKGGKTKTELRLSDPKSETSKRKIPIPECVIDILKQFQGKPDQFILTGTEKPVEPRTMQHRFAKILNNENLPSIHFHALRHMFASRCVRLGFDIKSLSEILGHSGVEITLNRYVHSSFEQKAAFMSRLNVTG